MINQKKLMVVLKGSIKFSEPKLDCNICEPTAMFPSVLCTYQMSILLKIKLLFPSLCLCILVTRKKKAWSTHYRSFRDRDTNDSRKHVLPPTMGCLNEQHYRFRADRPVQGDNKRSSPSSVTTDMIKTTVAANASISYRF